MIPPEQLIGMQYRLGADPERHGKADCLSLARHVVSAYGIELPPANRSWYRRLRRGDYAVFTDELPDNKADKLEHRLEDVICQVR